MNFPQSYKGIKDLFLENKTIKQIIFKNLSWLFFSESVTRVFTFFLAVFTARILGVENFGFLAFAISFTTLFAIVSSFGIDIIMVREFNQREEAKKELNFVFGLRVFLSFIALFLIIISSFFIKDNLAKYLVIVFGFVFFAKSILSFFISVFQAIQKMEYIALINIIESIILTVSVLFVLFTVSGVVLVSYMYLASSFLVLITAFLFVRRFSILNFPRLNLGIIKKYFSLSWPLALNAVLATTYIQIGLVIMGFWNMMEEVGWYQAAFKITNFVILPGSIIGAVFYPAISKHFKEARDKFQKIINVFFEAVSFFALPIVLGGFFLSNEIISFIYGREFFISGQIFKILIFYPGIFLFIIFIDYVLNAVGLQKVIFYTALGATLLNIFLNFILIPRYPLYGVAITALLCFFFIFVIRILVLKRINMLPSFRSLLAPLLSAIIMGFMLWSRILSSFHIILQVLIAGLAYTIAFLVLRNIIMPRSKKPQNFSSKKRICFIAEGDSAHTYRWIKYFANKDYEIHWLSFTPNNFGNIENVNFYLLKKFKKKSFSLLFNIFKVRRLMKKINPDIIHAHYVGVNGILAGFSSFNKPLVLTAWGSDILLNSKRKTLKFLIRFVLKKADMMTCDAEHIKKAMKDLGADYSKIKIIYFGVDINKFSRCPKTKELSSFVISSRNLEPIYDVAAFVKAMPLILENVPEARFVIAGQGRERKNLEELAKSLGVFDKIKFIGWVSEQELIKNLRNSDVYVSTSLSDAGIAASTAEAMACELPVVVTDFGNNKEWIKHGEGGFLIPLKDPETLADKVVCLLKDKNMRSRFGRFNREVIKKRNNYYNEMEKMGQIYEQIEKSFKKTTQAL